MSMLRVRTCLTKQAIGLTEVDQKRLLDGAKRYSSGDRQQDYINATQDQLASLRAIRTAIAAEYERKTGETVAAAPEPTPMPQVKATEQEVTETPKPKRNLPPKRVSEEAVMIAKSIETVETTKSKTEYVAEVAWLLGQLYGADVNDRRSPRVKTVQDFLDGLPKDTLFREAIREFARAEGVLRIMSSTGTANPVFELILKAEAFDLVKKVAAYENLPAEYDIPSIVPAPETIARESKGKPAREKFRLFDTPPPDKPGPINTNKAALELDAQIRNYNAMVDRPKGADRRKRIQTMERLWQAVVAEGTEDFITESGQPLSAYFTNDTPKTARIDGHLQFVTEEVTDEARAAVEADLRAARKIERDETGAAKKDDAGDYVSKSTLDQWNSWGTSERQRDTIEDDFDGRYFRDDGTPLTYKVPPGRVRMLVKEFLAKLKVRPTIHVYKSQADLKASNPELYARAAAARPKGDFDTTSAVGYSFGDGEVIIFTDRVATERQLKFVIAHETLGHFGLRAMMPGSELNAALNMVYDLSPRVRAVVDLAMQARGLPKSEAIEEYLADFAGVLDSNVLARFWARIKNFLNKFGVKFEDDMARYLVSQSRAYVRNGKVGGSFVNFRQMAERWLAIETLQDPDGTGRFAQSAEYYDETNRVAADDLYGVHSTTDMDVERAKRWMQDKGINLADGWKKLMLNLRTMNYASRENLGYRKLYEILRATVHMAASLRSKYNAMMGNSLNAAVEIAGKTVYGGTTKAQRKTANAMLRITSRVKLRNLTDKELKKLGALVTYEDGKAKINKEVLAALQARGRMTLDEFRNGFTFTEYKARPMTEAERQRLRDEYAVELQKLKDKGADVKELKALKDDYDSLISDDTYLAPVEVKFDPKAAGTENLTETSPEWVMYKEVRDAMDTAAIDLLEANFAAAQGERANVMRVVHNFLNRRLTTEDREFIQKIEDKYIKMRGENSTVSIEGFIQLDKASVDKANEFIIAFNKAVLGLDTDRNEALQAFFDQQEADDINAGIEGLKKGSDIPRDGNRRFAMQQAIQNLSLFEMSKDDAQLLAKRSIAGGYVPYGREGTWQVRVNAVDPNTGRVYKVSERYRQNLIYLQTPSKAEALRAAEFVNTMFDNGNRDGTFELEILNSNNEYEVRKVKLVAQPETARETMSSARETNLNEVIATITRFSIDLTPGERERLVVGLTRQNHRARTRLERSGNPGEDPDTMKYVSQHLEATASTVARKHNRHHLDRLFDDADGDSERLWKGSEDEYRRLEKQWKDLEADPAATPPQRQAAKREFEDYHYTYKIKNSQQNGNYYKDQGQRLLGFLDAQKDVEFTDFGSGELVSSIRTWTTFAMLGLSPATAILNFISLGTNTLPSLAGFNEKNGFGGGFGWGAANAELFKAMRDVKNASQSTLQYWDHLLQANDDGTLVDPQRIAAAGFTRWEAEFMRKEVASGSMQAALTNAMLGTARGKMTSGGAQKFAKGWMGLFNYSEQMARRSTGLSAFRLAFDRAIAEGKTEDQAFVAADKFAVEMIENTLGEYAMFNRPALFRGGVAQFVFMYKMFPVNMIQMLAALDRKTQLKALGILLLFSGLKGLPFAEDMMDIIDTIAQALGLGPKGLWRGSMEKSMAELIDSAVPGMTPLALRGVLNHVMPMNIADRTSLGNIVPGTGIGLAGADIGRELIEIGGPFASFMQGAIASSADIAKLALEPSVAGAVSTTRQLPITMLRAFGDTWAYANTGAIVSQKGYIVSPDLHAGVFLTRLLGFYPSSAVTENDVVRMGKRLIDYRRDVASRYYGRYVMARLSGNDEAAMNVFDDVDAWNEAAKGTELELSNFRQSANRALRDAKRTATQRYLRTVPVNARRETQRVMEMLMTDEELAASN